MLYATAHNLLSKTNTVKLSIQISPVFLIICFCFFWSRTESRTHISSGYPASLGSSDLGQPGHF